METAQASFSIGAVAGALATAIGPRLTVIRSQDSIHWNCDGDSAIVSLRADGTLDAAFVAADVDRMSGKPVAAVYLAEGNRYALRAEDCERMVGDMIAFFSGAREPRFSFVDAVV